MTWTIIYIFLDCIWWLGWAGHYLPNLVQQVVNHNKDPGAYQLKNLKGFQVSNFTTQSQVLDKFHVLIAGLGAWQFLVWVCENLAFTSLWNGFKRVHGRVFFSLQIFIFLSWKIWFQLIQQIFNGKKRSKFTRFQKIK